MREDRVVRIDGMIFRIHDEYAKLEKYEPTGRTRLVIPQEIEGVPVLYIGANAFCENADLMDVVLPETLLKIEYNAFAMCLNLREMTFPKSLMRIEPDAFQWSGILRVEFLGECILEANAFYGCEHLKVVSLGGPTTIGCGTFNQCKRLIRVNGSHHITEIGATAFSGCVVLDKLHTNALSVGDSAFSRCTALEEFSCSDSAEVGVAVFIHCPKLRCVRGGNLNISDTVVYSENGEYIGLLAGCDIERIVLPKNMQRIPSYAFAKTRASEVIFPEGIKVIPQGCFEGSELLEKVVAPSVVNIEFGAFQGCRLLSVVDTRPLDNIGPFAFNCCESLRSIECSDACRCISSDAFYGCTRLQEVKAEGVREVCNSAFESCCSLRELPRMPLLKKIEDDAFNGCRLRKLDLPESLETIGSRSLGICRSAASFKIPDGVDAPKDALIIG